MEPLATTSLIIAFPVKVRLFSLSDPPDALPASRIAPEAMVVVATLMVPLPPRVVPLATETAVVAARVVLT
jgi:hypothetical protein